MRAEQLDTAIVFYRRSFQLDPTNHNAKRYILWINVKLEARGHPVKLTGENLSKLVGKYGPRCVRLDNDTLPYLRKGSGCPERYLYLSKPDFFGLQGGPDWRLRLDLDESRQAVVIEDWTLTGMVDQYMREE